RPGCWWSSEAPFAGMEVHPGFGAAGGADGPLQEREPAEAAVRRLPGRRAAGVLQGDREDVRVVDRADRLGGVTLAGIEEPGRTRRLVLDQPELVRLAAARVSEAGQQRDALVPRRRDD